MFITCQDPCVIRAEVLEGFDGKNVTAELFLVTMGSEVVLSKVELQEALTKIERLESD